MGLPGDLLRPRLRLLGPLRLLVRPPRGHLRLRLRRMLLVLVSARKPFFLAAGLFLEDQAYSRSFRSTTPPVAADRHERLSMRFQRSALPNHFYSCTVNSFSLPLACTSHARQSQAGPLMGAHGWGFRSTERLEFWLWTRRLPHACKSLALRHVPLRRTGVDRLVFLVASPLEE